MNIVQVAVAVVVYLWLSGVQAVAEITWLSQDFEGGGTPYTLWNKSGTAPAVLLDGGTGITNCLRLTYSSSGVENYIAFDETLDLTSYLSLTIEFDFRGWGSNEADGWCLLLVPTADHGTNFADLGYQKAETPALTNAFGIRYNVKDGDYVSLYWDSNELERKGRRLATNSWFHAKVEIVDPGPANDVEVTYTQTSDIHGSAGTPDVLWSNYTITGMSSIYSFRLQCSGRTGSRRFNGDLDNFEGVAIPPPPTGTVLVIR